MYISMRYKVINGGWYGFGSGCECAAGWNWYEEKELRSGGFVVVYRGPTRTLMEMKRHMFNHAVNNRHKISFYDMTEDVDDPTW